MDKPIGVFDSGLGGLTCVRELLNIMPNEDIVYFGDTGRVPYGNKSDDIIKKFALQDINFLKEQDVKMIVIACGTVSSVLVNLEGFFLPVVSVVLPTTKAALKLTKNKKIGVIGTSATIRSNSYRNAIKNIDESIDVFQKDCPLFVPLVEDGVAFSEKNVVEALVKRYLKDIKEQKVDTLILGCTHYPLLKEEIKKFMGQDVALIDSGKETAIFAAEKLKEEGLLRKKSTRGKCSFFVSDSVDQFSEISKKFLGENIVYKVKKIDIEKY